jgi:hypothetical protein
MPGQVQKIRAGRRPDESCYLEYAANQMEKWLRDGTFPPGYFSKGSIATLRVE